MINTMYDCIEGPRQMTLEEQQEWQKKKEECERKKEQQAIDLFIKYVKQLTDAGVADGNAYEVASTILFGPRQNRY